MKIIVLYSALLIMGLIGSQWLPVAQPELSRWLHEPITFLSMTCLSYIMILVGTEFEIDKKNPRSYIVDYWVAATAAAFPWIFVAIYYIWAFYDGQWADYDSWRDTLLISRFAAPTSAGILFSMLAAAGLAGTWVFKKARILAIFDDLDTVLLMIPLKVLFVGLRWQLFLLIVVMLVCLVLAWKWQHHLKLPISFSWFLVYASLITLFSEFVYLFSGWLDPQFPIHIEVLLPSFVLGMLLYAKHEQLQEEKMVKNSRVISAFFMVLVGLSMPYMGAYLTAEVPWQELLLHVLAVTLISNIGKCFVLFCYKRQVPWHQRLAVAIGMFPRGEVGAGIIIVTLSYGLGGLAVSVAMLSLCLNLVLTGIFITIVKRLCLLDKSTATKSPAEAF